MTLFSLEGPAEEVSIGEEEFDVVKQHTVWQHDFHIPMIHGHSPLWELKQNVLKYMISQRVFI